MVEGQGALARLWAGRRHRHELQLPDGREDPRRQRPEGGPARLSDRPERHLLYRPRTTRSVATSARSRGPRTGRSSTRRFRRSTSRRASCAGNGTASTTSARRSPKSKSRRTGRLGITSTSTRSIWRVGTQVNPGTSSSRRAAPGPAISWKAAPARSSGDWAVTGALSRWGRARRRRGSTTAASSRTARSPSSTTARTRRSTASRVGCESRSTSRPSKRASSPPTPIQTRRCSPQARATCRRSRIRNALVGYGGVPAISEYAAKGGSLLFDAHLPFDMSFYRAYRFPWSGRPSEPARGARRPERHGRRDDRPCELERRHRSCFLARARGQAHRVAHGAGHDPGRQWLRELDDPAARSTPTWRCRRSTRPATCSAPQRRSSRSATPPRSER